MIVENIKIVNPLDGNSLDLYWDDVDDIVDEYIVYRMDIDTNPDLWIDIGTVNYPFFRDTNYNSRRNYWYNVAYKNEADEESDLGTPVKYKILIAEQRYAFVWHRNMYKKTQIAFRFTAEPIRILFRNRTGKKCSCVEAGWDAPKSCPTCHGSGYLSKSVFEFAPNTSNVARIYNSGETIDIQAYGSEEVNTPSALVLGLPILRAGDIIIRGNSADGITRVYTISDVTIKEHGSNPGFVTFQKLTLDEKGGTEILKTIITPDEYEELNI